MGDTHDERYTELEEMDQILDLVVKAGQIAGAKSGFAIADRIMIKLDRMLDAIVEMTPGEIRPAPEQSSDHADALRLDFLESQANGVVHFADAAWHPPARTAENEVIFGSMGNAVSLRVAIDFAIERRRRHALKAAIQGGAFHAVDHGIQSKPMTKGEIIMTKGDFPDLAKTYNPTIHPRTTPRPPASMDEDDGQ